jgi:Ca-activated chloride channel family protein
MLGRYEEAIESYGRALDSRPDWPEAEQNREIARVRLERLAPPDDDAGGTGGALGADEIVFDDSGRVNESGSEVVSEGGEMSEEELRSVWLRRVENDPADFLRARFAYQLYRDEQEVADE